MVLKFTRTLDQKGAENKHVNFRPKDVSIDEVGAILYQNPGMSYVLCEPPRQSNNSPNNIVSLTTSPFLNHVILFWPCLNTFHDLHPEENSIVNQCLCLLVLAQ